MHTLSFVPNLHIPVEIFEYNEFLAFFRIIKVFQKFITPKKNYSNRDVS